MTSAAPATLGRPQSDRLLFICVIAVASLLRLAGLDAIPPPLNHDEASRGYDAWSLWVTGTDRHGQSWPAFLESYGPGDYTAALASYLMIPIVAVLGPTPQAFRLPNAVLGAATVAVLFLWLRPKRGAVFATVAAMTLAFDPWHVSLTRTAYEFGLSPFFLTSALAAMDNCGFFSTERGPQRTRRLFCAALGGVCLALFAWSYPAARLYTPLFLVSYCIVFHRSIRRRFTDVAERRTILCFAAALLVFSIPLLSSLLLHPDRLAARARVALLDFRFAVWGEMLPTLAKQYLAYFSPAYLWSWPDLITTVPVPGVGMHFVVAAPFMILGAIRGVIGARSDDWRRMLLIWLLLAPVPAAICKDIQPHMVRVVAACTLWPILAAEGLDWALQTIAGLRPTMRRAGMAALFAAFVINAAYFCRQYFFVYPETARFAFQATLIEAIDAVRPELEKADFVLVTNRLNQPYIYPLLYAPIPPRRLANERFVKCRGPVNFDQVVRAGKWFFMPVDPVNYSDAAKRFQEEWATLGPRAAGFVIERPGLFQGGERWRVIGNDTQRDALEIRRWRVNEPASRPADDPASGPGRPR